MTIDEFWASVGGGSAFTQDEIAAMCSESEINGEDGLLIHHHDETYFIPKSSISAYFETHVRPGKRMTREDERAALLKKIAELEQVNSRLQQAQVVPEKTKPVMQSAPPVEEPEGENDAPLFEPPLPRPQPMDEIKRELERDLKGKQPIRAKKD